MNARNELRDIMKRARITKPTKLPSLSSGDQAIYSNSAKTTKRPAKRARPRLSALVATQSDTALIEMGPDKLTKKKKMANIRKHKRPNA